MIAKATPENILDPKPALIVTDIMSRQDDVFLDLILEAEICKELHCQPENIVARLVDATNVEGGVSGMYTLVYWKRKEKT